MCMFTCNVLFSQAVTLANKYNREDSGDVNKDVTLLLYSDSSFFYFGIYDNKKIPDSYIWYSYGHYSSSTNNIILNSTDFSNKKDNIIQLVKGYYGKRSDHRRIENYYEFTDEIYRNYILNKNLNSIVDTKKSMEYYLVK